MLNLPGNKTREEGCNTLVKNATEISIVSLARELKRLLLYFGFVTQKPLHAC